MDDLLLDEARRITGVTKTTALVREGAEDIDRTRERRQGIGFINAHLLASTALADMGIIWTCDKQFQKIAIKLKLAFD